MTVPQRWLALHNFRSNPQVFQDQLKDYIPLLGENAEVDFVAAPHAGRGTSLYPGEPREWWYSPTYSSFMMGWLGDLGLEESKTFLKNKILQDGPYHGILGFSQGGGMAHFALAEGLIKRGILFSPVVPLGHSWPPSKDLDYQAIVFLDPADLTGEGYPLNGMKIVSHSENHTVPAMTEEIRGVIEEFTSK